MKDEQSQLKEVQELQDKINRFLVDEGVYIHIAIPALIGLASDAAKHAGMEKSVALLMHDSAYLLRHPEKEENKPAE